MNYDYIKVSEEFKNFISKLNFSGIKMKTLKNKSIYKIKDGYYHFNVNLKNQKCTICKGKSECSLKKCKHIYYILINKFKLTNEELMFVWVNDNITNLINDKLFEIKEQDVECPVCIENVFNKYTDMRKIIHCLNCGKFIHKKCYNKTLTKKCLLCYNKF